MSEVRKVDIQVTDKQALAWEAWENDLIDDVVFGGAAGGGKSMVGCQLLVSTAIKYPGCRQFLGRKELKSLMGTSYITLTQHVFKQYGLIADKDWHLDGKQNVVIFSNGSTIDLLDLAYSPTDPLYDRLGSREYTRGWIEEASEVAFKAYDVLKSRVGRWMNEEKGIKSKLGISLNPSQDWPYRLFYDVWKKAGKPVNPKKPLVSIKSMVNGKEVVRTFVFIPALAKDNPFTSGEYQRNLATISDPVLRQRLMDGDWEYSSANDTLFPVQSIADLFTNKVKESRESYLIVDAARFGGDRIVLNHWRGWNSFKIDTYTHLSTTKTAELIRTSLEKYGIPREFCLIDEDGIGGGVLDLVPGALGFHGGASPFGVVGEKESRENYENLRSQCAYHLSKMANERKVAVIEQSLEIRELLAEDLKQIKRRDADKDGKLKISKKEDMKSALGRSPDVGDTFIMRSYFDVRIREQEFAQTGKISIFIPDL